MQDLDSHLERQLHWIGAADGKATTIFAIDTAMLAVLAALTPQKDAWTVFPAIVATIAAVLLLTSIGGLAAATFPRVAGPKGSLLFFGGICEYDEEDFVKRLTHPDLSEMTRDYARQVYRNAQIAKTKYWCIKIAMIAIFIAVLPWLLAIYALY